MMDKPEELLKKMKDGKQDEVVIEMLEKGEEDSRIHLKAIATSEIKNKEIAKDLRREIAEKSKNLDKFGGLVEKKDLQISELQREIQQLKINLEKANKTIEKKELEISDLHLSNQNNEKLEKAGEEIKTIEKKYIIHSKKICLSCLRSRISLSY